MSEEFETTEPIFTAFWPLLILSIGLLGWTGYQDYAVNAQRNVFKQTLEAQGQNVNGAQYWQMRYGKLMQDLNDSSAKDATTAAILKEAVQAGIQAGLIHVNQQNAAASPGTSAAAVPAPAK